MDQIERLFEEGLGDKFEQNGYNLEYFKKNIKKTILEETYDSCTGWRSNILIKTKDNKYHCIIHDCIINKKTYRWIADYHWIADYEGLVEMYIKILMDIDLGSQGRQWSTQILNYIHKKNVRKLAKIKKLEKELEGIKQEIEILKYRPDGPGYEMAKKEFNNLRDFGENR